MKKVLLSFQDTLYASELDIIVNLQKECEFMNDFFLTINKWSGLEWTLGIIFPLVCTIDSIWAAELLLSLSVGGWLNSMIQWLIRADRPYWWVKETNVYDLMRVKRPTLKLFPCSCETGSGISSVNETTVVITALLIFKWIKTLLDRIMGKCPPGVSKFFNGIVFGICTFLAMAQSYLATHFPHQCIIGGLIGILVVRYVPGPIINRVVNFDEEYKTMKEKANEPVVFGQEYGRLLMKKRILNVIFCLVATGISLGTLLIMNIIGRDPMWSIRMAFKRCPSVEYMHYKTTTHYTFVRDIGNMGGVAASLTPKLKEYRFDTYPWNLPIATFFSIINCVMFIMWEVYIPKDNNVLFFGSLLISNTIRTICFLRVIPPMALSISKYFFRVGLPLRRRKTKKTQ